MRTFAALAAAGLLLMAAPARAALRVTGIVQDSAGRPIPVAIVTVRGDGRSVKAPSDTEGRFAFTWDGPDEVAITVDAKGYAERRQTVRLGEAGGALTLVLTRLAFGEEVTVTGGRRQGLGETPASINIVTSEDLAATAAPVLDDALRYVPGFTLFRRSAAGRWCSGWTGAMSPARPRRRCSFPGRRRRPSPKAPSAPSVCSGTSPGASAAAAPSPWARASTNGTTSTRAGSRRTPPRSYPIGGRAP